MPVCRWAGGHNDRVIPPWGLFMFASLSDRLQAVFASVRRETRLTPASVETALREIRLALLEADVNFKVVKAFIDRACVTARSTRAVLESLTPTQQVVAIVRDELLALMGEGQPGLSSSKQRPQVVMCCLACRGPARPRPR